MRRLSRAAAGAALAAGALVLAPGAAHAGTAVPDTTITLTTKIADVHVRSVPHSGAGSKVVGTIATAGTSVSVVCYVVTSGRYWFQISSPSGYAAARNFDYARPHGNKVPPGLTACTL
jgi:hypothetical protein